jgi:hypothetical protein
MEVGMAQVSAGQAGHSFFQGTQGQYLITHTDYIPEMQLREYCMLGATAATNRAAK